MALVKANNEKWVVGYGHASVAEHAVLSIAIENVSILASKVIEDNRLASYTEKSTRYQIFDKGRYYKPASVMQSKYGARYQDTLDDMFEKYEIVVGKLIEYIKKQQPLTADQPLKYWEASCKAQACDVARYLLPTATYTNLGMTINARGLEYALVKFLSHPLEELRAIGREMKEVALKVTPTLIKFADEREYIKQHVELIRTESCNHYEGISPEQPRSAVELVWHDPLAVEKYITALLYHGGQQSYHQIFQTASRMSWREKERIVDASFVQRGPFDAPPRECEVVEYMHDILMDYGAFRDIQRHRMSTQMNQDVTVVHGYEMPYKISEAHLESEFETAMARAAELYHEVSGDFPYEAQYCVPLAYRKRTLVSWNLRELHHVIALRSTPKGHPSYRRIAQQLYSTIEQVHPLLAKYIRVDTSGEYLSTVGTPAQFEQALKS